MSGWARVTAALVGLGSGAALLATILIGIWLPVGLLVALVVAAGAVAMVVRSGTPHARRRALATVLAGAASGLVATLAYDASRAVLSQLDPAPFNPFEAIRVFGLLIAGTTAPAITVYAVGTAFHVLNGTAFAVSYAFLLGRDGASTVRWALLTGVGWGVALEMFQLTLYPGWLDIRAYDEFVRVSFLGHVVYGGTLGLAYRGLARASARASS